MRIACFLSAAQVDQRYHKAVQALGYALGKQGHTLVFGGYSQGLMRSIADGFAEARAPIIGVVPDFFEDTHIKHQHLSEVYHTKELADRKTYMIQISDACIVLPGGTGTMDELFDVLALKSTHRVHGQVIIYNLFGFYDLLLAQLQTMKHQGFIRDQLDELYQVCSTPDEVIDYLDKYKGD